MNENIQVGDRILVKNFWGGVFHAQVMAIKRGFWGGKEYYCRWHVNDHDYGTHYEIGGVIPSRRVICKD